MEEKLAHTNFLVKVLEVKHQVLVQKTHERFNFLEEDILQTPRVPECGCFNWHWLRHLVSRMCPRPRPRADASWFAVGGS